MNDKCEKCGGHMTIGQILSGSYDVHGERGIMQYNPSASSGKLEDCFKCETCGHSVTSEQLKKFKVAAKILLQNQKDCEQFKERDGL
jgi:hypothetical protein